MARMGRRILVWSLKDVKNSIERMTSSETKFDCIIFIEGNRGLGKSTLAFKLLSGLGIQHKFSPRRDIVYSREDVLKHLATKINGAIFADEMVNVAYKREFYQQDQILLLKGFDMYRDSRNVFIGCIPKFTDLDTKIQKVCKLRITVVKRGIAIIQLKLKRINSSDPWDVRNNERIEASWSKGGDFKPKYSQLTTFRGILKFGDLTPQQREEYESIKKEKRNKIFSEYQDETLLGQPENLFLKNLIQSMKDGKITPESFDLIAKVNSQDSESLRRKINLMLKKDNDDKRWKDYVMTEKAKKRKDFLGFKKSDEAKQGPNNDEERTDEESFQLERNNSSNEEKERSGDEEVINDDDLFGFSE